MIHWPLPQLLLQLCLPTMLPSYQLLLWGRFHRERESKGELLKIDIRAGEGQEKAVRIPLGAGRTPRPEGTPKPQSVSGKSRPWGRPCTPKCGHAHLALVLVQGSTTQGQNPTPSFPHAHIPPSTVPSCQSSETVWRNTSALHSTAPS